MSASFSEAMDVASLTDAAGWLYVAGATSGSLDGAGTPVGSDLFLAKFDLGGRAR